MRGLIATVTVLLSAGSLALAQDGPSPAKKTPAWVSFDLPTVDFATAGAFGGPQPYADERGFRGAPDEWQPEKEVSWRSGALGLGLREENGRIKGGPYIEAGDWRLDLRPLSSDNVLDIDGMTLRLTTRFGD